MTSGLLLLLMHIYDNMLYMLYMLYMYTYASYLYVLGSCSFFVAPGTLYSICTMYTSFGAPAEHVGESRALGTARLLGEAYARLVDAWVFSLNSRTVFCNPNIVLLLFGNPSSSPTTVFCCRSCLNPHHGSERPLSVVWCTRGSRLPCTFQSELTNV